MPRRHYFRGIPLPYLALITLLGGSIIEQCASPVLPPPRLCVANCLPTRRGRWRQRWGVYVACAWAAFGGYARGDAVAPSANASKAAAATCCAPPTKTTPAATHAYTWPFASSASPRTQTTRLSAARRCDICTRRAASRGRRRWKGNALCGMWRGVDRRKIISVSRNEGYSLILFLLRRATLS